MSFQLNSSHLLVAVTVGGAMLSLIGCANTPKPPPDRRIIKDDVQYAADQQFVKEPFDEQARLGILRQRTLFDADFQIDSAVLSALGRKNVTILAQAVLESGGYISVRQGSASAELYAARIAEVRARLVAAGVQVERSELVDRHPGGPGEATAEALVIRKDIRSIPLPNPIGEKLNPQGGGSTMQGTP